MLVRVITCRPEITAESCVMLPDGDTHSKAVRFHSRTAERTNHQYQYFHWPVDQSNFQLLTVLFPLEAGKKGFVGSGSDRLKQTSTEILAQVRKRFFIQWAVTCVSWLRLIMPVPDAWCLPKHSSSNSPWTCAHPKCYTCLGWLPPQIANNRFHGKYVEKAS